MTDEIERLRQLSVDELADALAKRWPRRAPVTAVHYMAAILSRYQNNADTFQRQLARFDEDVGEPPADVR